jgi:hypothetical protein
MKKNLVTTKNSLADIINFLKDGYIVCLHAGNNRQYYFLKESLEELNDECIIYINLTKNPSLLNEDEWPWYIKNEGFVEYKSISKLPINDQNVYYLKL